MTGWLLTCVLRRRLLRACHPYGVTLSSSHLKERSMHGRIFILGISSNRSVFWPLALRFLQDRDQLTAH